MIFYLMKVFSEAQQADDFVKGKVYANRLCYFKNIEDSEVRGDRDEGAIVLPRDGLTIDMAATNQATGEVDRIRILSEELAGPLVIQPEWCDHINVFCMYAGHIGDDKRSVEVDHISECIEQLKIPADCQKLGKYAVIITKGPEFVRRVHQAAKRQKYKLAARLVKYYDAEVGMQSMQSEVEAVFSKRKIYEHQREYRFAIGTGTTGRGAITLDIGALVSQ